MEDEKIRPKILGLFLVFFVVQLAVNLGNYTSLIYSAVSFAGVSKPAFLVTFQTLGSLLAFLLLNSPKSTFSHKISLPVLLLLNAVFALLSANLFNFYVWIGFVMVRITLSTILVSRLQALLPVIAVSKEATQHHSKSMQSLYMFASLLTLSLSPIVQKVFGVANVYLLDMMFMLVLCPVVILSGLSSVSETTGQDVKSAGMGKLSFAEILSFSPYVVWMWLVAGSFHIIEIPYLTKIVKTSSAELTVLFLIAGIGAILGSVFVPKKFISVHKNKTALLSTVLISVVSLVYLRTVNLPLIMGILFFLGIFNAVFNISVANIIYEKVPGGKQTAAFAFYRLNSNFCIIAAAVVMSALNDIGLAFRGQLLLTGVAVLLFAGLTVTAGKLKEETV